MAAHLQYWYFLIGGPLDEETGLVTNFYAYGQHCGEALFNALQAATAELGITQPEATEAARLDTLADFAVPDGLVQLADLVFSGPKNYSYPLATESDFIPPTGIIKAAEEGADYALIKEAFVALKISENDSFELELVAGKDKLISTFLQSLAWLPQPDQLEICLKGHWHNEKSELWAISAADLPEGIADFLLTTTADTLENGFVECAAVVSASSTRLILTEHKKLVFQTNDQGLFNAFGGVIMDLGFEQTTELHSLEHNFYHWHYRPAHSLDAPELRLLLLDSGFRFTKSWGEEAEPA